ncbi:hypothetical protein [Anaerosacchariphilus polymeriproducens]|uniref:Uncharacterized protein n=1 Tax=Anaerosacchariphilus polymeriproducens TaxID=1812858 RepID=A0A371AUX3_9FIRM|nr:hypothetical protein [Anaerosacchariphilus polymeriproducens]RDU23339.1 hypothetical protein DWV06_09795 [Anaerosacchariphilus polymeriproducens]
MNQERNKIQKKIWAIEIGLVLSIAAYIAFTLIFKIFNILAFQIIVVVFLVLIQLIEAFIEPYWMGHLKELSSDSAKKSAYIKMVLLGVSSVICLSVFMFMIGENDQSGYSSVGFYFAIGAILINRLKHKEKRKFLGIEEETEEKIEKNYEPQNVNEEENSKN